MEDSPPRGWPPGYEKPLVTDYGDLTDLTASDAMLASVGFGDSSAALLATVPVHPGDHGAPGGFGGQDVGAGLSGTPTGVEQPAAPPGEVTESPDVAGRDEQLPSGEEGSGPVAGKEEAVGGEGAAGGGGGESGLPFTGFPVAMVGLAGSALTFFGALLRRATRRR